MPEAAPETSEDNFSVDTPKKIESVSTGLTENKPTEAPPAPVKKVAKKKVAKKRSKKKTAKKKVAKKVTLTPPNQ